MPGKARNRRPGSLRLRPGEARYRGLLDRAFVGVFMASPEGRVLWGNQALATILGYASAEELIAAVADSAPQIWVDPAERSRWLQLLESQGTVRRYECQFRRRDGAVIWVSLSCQVVRGADGRASHTEGWVDDITERRQTRDALLASEVRLLSAVEAAGLGFYESGESGLLSFLDDRVRELLGVPPGEEARGRDYWLAHIHPEDLPRVLQKSQAILAAGGVVQVDAEYRYHHPSRGLIWVHHWSRVMVRDASGRAVRLLGVVQDITARRQSEEALRVSQARLASGADLAGLGFYEITDGGNFTYLDDRSRAICGFPPDAASGVLAGSFWLEHVHPDDRARILDTEQRLNDGRLERVSVEYRYLHPEHGERWIHHLAIVEQRAESGRAARIRGVVRDITDRKQVERELAQQRLHLAHVARVSSLGQLASSLAHELNQPLGAILRNAEAAELLLEEPSPDLHEVRAILADIRSDDHRAGEVIDRMRALVRRRAIEKAPLNPSQLASEVIAILRPDADLRGVRLALEASPNMPPVAGDRVQLQQVLLNLLLNAMDAVEGHPRGERRVSVRLRTADAAVAVSVSDNGTGVPPAALPRIFEPFYTSKPNGLGMGLAIARGIVEAHEGRLWAEDSPGGGATFTFTLPVSRE